MIRTSTLTLLSLILLLLMPAVLAAQTCSCAGAPLVNSQSLGAVEKGNLVIGLTTDFNNIDKLFSGSDELDSRTSERSTFTTLAEANYGLGAKFTLSGTFSYVQKTRTTGLQNPQGSQELNASGIGDTLFLLKYNVIEQTLWKPYQLIVGGGFKAPLGTNSLRSGGLALNADMQPGTGSWDGIGWILFSYTVRSQNLNIYSVNSIKRTTSASRFNQNDQYRFGNEFNSILGMSKPAFDTFSLSLQLKYRTAEADQRNDSRMPSTGGEWLNIIPGVGYSFTERLSLQVAGEIPLYQNVNGTQPSTTYIVRASMFFSLDKANTGFNLGLPNNNRIK